MSAGQLLDVSTLEPPEPLFAVLDAIARLPPGGYLRVLHRREPYPLYPRLIEEGFDYLTRPGSVTAFEVLIWRRGDAHAFAAVQELLGTAAPA